MRTPETVRELDARWESMTHEQRLSESRERNKLSESMLRPMLFKGVKIRAYGDCGSSEATFTFDHWDGEWIKSKSGKSVSPGSVYSVNGVIFRV